MSNFNFAKGQKLYIEGKLQTRKWTDQNNQERYTTDVVIVEFEPMGRGNERAQGQPNNAGQNQATNTGTPQSNEPSPVVNQSSQNGDMQEDEYQDDIPF